MSEPEQKTKPGLVARLRERRQDRRQRKAWRREQSRGGANLYDAHNRGESSNYAGGGFFKSK
jgi:hypothetical protein